MTDLKCTFTKRDGSVEVIWVSYSGIWSPEFIQPEEFLNIELGESFYNELASIEGVKVDYKIDYWGDYNGYSRPQIMEAEEIYISERVADYKGIVPFAVLDSICREFEEYPSETFGYYLDGGTSEE